MATKTWREIQEKHSKLTPEQREATRARARAQLALERVTLAELRRARAMTQATMAETTGMAQGDVSRLEHRADAYIGTVRRFVEALGGSFRMVVEFPDAAPVEIEGFGGGDSLAEPGAAHEKASEKNRDTVSVSDGTKERVAHR
jgi:transcriptional regulator with XRE-family HTH domain